MSTSILIVDDNSGFRRAARLILEEEGYDVVGEAPGVKSGLAAARELQPDVVLLDVHLPDGNGFDAASELAGGPVVVMCSSYEESAGEELARRSGARAFVPKHELSGPRMTELLG
jgi:two-component system nitrate/nitrite response regulator NarL